MKVNINVNLQPGEQYYERDYVLELNEIPRIGEEILIEADGNSQVYTSYFKDDTRRWLVVERIVHDLINNIIDLYALDITEQIRNGTYYSYNELLKKEFPKPPSAV